MIVEVVEIQLPFDAVDALVHECLPGNYIGIQEPRGGVKFEWEQMAGWRSACRITDKEPGDLGCVRIYGKDTRLTAIQIDGPEPVKSRLPLHREKEPIVAIEDRDDRRAAWSTLFMQLRKEADEIYNRRRKLHGAIINRFWLRFNDEITTGLRAKSDAPRAVDRKRRRDIQERQQLVKLYWQQGYIDKDIANQLGYSISTIKRDRAEMGLKKRGV